MPSIDHDIKEAVRDTVTVEGRRLGRSHTSTQPTLRANPPAAVRSQSQDSSPEKKTKHKPKKSSQHADVIDRLDFTGVGPMFHHDGPFDACAPSRNRQKSKAPMMAWTSRHDEASDQPQTVEAPTGHTGAYHAYDAPKKKVDAIAEAWGIHEPEPFEEFFAGGGKGSTPASSIHNGIDSHGARRPTRDTRREDGGSGAMRSRPARRSVVPPPQPIFVSEPQQDSAEFGPVTPPANGNGFPKRNKSIMHRIRKMRDSPNVPVGASGYDEPSSPMETNGTRPTHRSQNSFLGRFGGSPRPEGGSSEPFVLIDATTNKDLPATPAAQEPIYEGDYGVPPSSPGAGGLGRKTSLMKKVGRVVRGTK